jgi:hypothetical protein
MEGPSHARHPVGQCMKNAAAIRLGTLVIIERLLTCTLATARTDLVELTVLSATNSEILRTRDTMAP